MSSNLVIVALPADDDPIWKVSSEKKPHLTLCFLGDAKSNPNVERIVEFVDHAVTVCEHGSFYMDVDYRETLGPDKADMFFFRKDWGTKWIAQFRNQLLKNNDIRTAYESVQQYPEWTPHLTLGYPTAPAHDDKMPEYGIRMISFDRIAVWTGDFDGPEFRLEWPDRYEELAVAYSSMNEERVKLGLAAIEHHGVKGMRWGKRSAKDTAVTVNGKAKMVTAKKAAKLDKSWEKNQFTLPKGIERHNAMAEHFNGRIGALNDKHKNDDFSKEAFDSPAHWSPKYKEYMNGVAKLEEAGFRHAVTQVHGSSPTGKKKMEVEYTPDGDLRMVVKSTDAAHAVDSGDEVFLFKVTRDSNGLITAVEPSDDLTVTDEMAQTESFVDDYLAHYGIKGMRWGSSKSSEVTPTSVAVTTTPHNRKTTKIEVKGGGGHDAHPDAIKVAEARQKLRKSGSAALSNGELKDVAERLQLESNVARLEGERKSGSTFVGKLLRKHGSQQLDRGVNRAAGQVTDEAATRVGRAATKKIFKAGVAAAL